MLRSCTLYLSIFVIATVAGSAQHSPQPTSATAASPIAVLLSKARSLEGRGRIDLAAQVWRQVLMADPNQTEALAGLLRSARQSGRQDLEKQYEDRLRKLDAKNPAIMESKSERITGQQQKRLQEADALARNQQFEQAVMIYREVFGDNPPPGGWAIAYYEALAATPGGWETATAGFERLMHKYPDSQDYKLSLGRLWTYRPSTRLAGMKLLESLGGNPLLVNKAKAAWRQALLWEAQNPAILPSLRAYLSRYPDPELARIDLQIPKAAPPVAGPVRSRDEIAGYAALQAGDLAQAKSSFDRALQNAPKSPQALAGLGFIRLKEQDFATAADLFTAATAEAPHDSIILDALATAQFWKTMKQGQSDLASGNTDEAIRRYGEALKFRPDNRDATRALAGALMKAGRSREAEPLFENLATRDPRDAQLWFEALNARFRSGGSGPALAFAKRIPAAAQRELRSDVKYYAVMSEALLDAGRYAESKQYLQEGIDVANVQNRQLPAPVQLQFADLFLRHRYFSEAASLFSNVTATDNSNVDAWQGLAAALVAGHKEAACLRAVERMPKKTYEAALLRPAFLRSLSTVHMALGHVDQAESYLRQSLRVEGAAETKESLAAQLQLAQIWIRKGEWQSAERLLRRLQQDNPDDPDVWKTLMAVLHQQGRDQEVLQLTARFPDNVRAGLQDDADYVNLLVASLTGTGELEEALRQAQRAAALLRQQERAVPADLQIQTAWLLLNTGGDERELYSLLSQAGARPDLTRDQSLGIQDVWAVWSLRRAEMASATGDQQRCLEILGAAVTALPANTKVKAAFAGNLLKAGQTKRAFDVYLHWGLRGATAEDYAGAVSSALAQHDPQIGQTWLTRALGKWPRNGQLLRIAGNLAASKGDYKTAKDYWKSAASALRTEQTTRPATPTSVGAPAAPTDPVRNLAGILVPGDLPDTPRRSNAFGGQTATRPAAPQDPPMRTLLPVPKRISDDWQPGGSQPGSGANVIKAPFVEKNSDVLPRLTQSTGHDPSNDAVPGTANRVLPPVPGPLPELIESPKPEMSALDEVENQLAAVSARNTAFTGMGGSVRGRSGEAGYERLLIQEADMEASAVIMDRVRVSAIARPTYLDAGTPDGLSLKRFGLMPEGSTFGAQSVGGVGGEVQISTATFGLRLGSTPRQFAVPNFIGGLRFRPGNGPLTILLERDNVRDSMLAFAGVRDPITHRVWGGVVANSASAIGNWGGAESGFYASAGYQRLTGTEVLTNTRIDGNAGAYWRVISTPDGSLTAGANFNAMHYDKNLRYFTLGQGGYFSPQQYMLFNIPLQWRGSRNRLQYVAGGSLGAQHFQEDASPYFPTLPVFQGLGGSMYPQLASTGANYSLNVRVAYQLTPRWFLGAWVDANNARNYNSQGAGFYLRYSMENRPLTPEDQVPSIPDWRGAPLFGLQ